MVSSCSGCYPFLLGDTLTSIMTLLAAPEAEVGTTSASLRMGLSAFITNGESANLLLLLSLVPRWSLS